MSFERIFRLPMLECGLINSGKPIVSENKLKEKLKKQNSPFGLMIHSYMLPYDTVSVLRDHPFLKIIGIRGCFPDPSLLEYLRTLDTMEEIWLQFGRMNDDFMQNLSQIPNVTRLILDQTKIRDKGMAALRSMHSLEELNLRSTRITDEGLLNISSLTNLKWLNLWGCRNITDLGVESLTELRELEKLDLTDVKRITDNTVFKISRMKKLKDLSLPDCPLISDKGLEKLSENTSITRFHIGSDKISKQGLGYMSRLTNLSELWVFSDQLRDEDLLALSSLPKLRSLRIGSRLLTNGLFSILGQFPNLDKVDVFSDKITDACLGGLSHCSHIKNVYICSTRMSKRVNEIMKKRQPGIEWVRQYCSISEESTDMAISNRKSPSITIPESQYSRKAGTTWTDDVVTMKSLRFQLKDIISSLKEYICSIEEDERLCTLTDIKSLKSILEEYLRTISGKKGDKKNLYKATRVAVKKLNELDEKTENELMETELREELCEFFNNGSEYVGIEIEDIADEWREW